MPEPPVTPVQLPLVLSSVNVALAAPAKPIEAMEPTTTDAASDLRPFREKRESADLEKAKGKDGCIVMVWKNELSQRRL
jgi:hypothetical protein